MKHRIRHSIGVSLRKGALTLACGILAVSSYGQQSKPGSGSVINSRPTTLLKSSPQACTVDQLKLTFQTGNDDLRGGKNNLNVEIHFRDGSMKKADNVNSGANWPNNSINTVVIPLNRPIAPSDIKQIRLIHLAQGGFAPHPVGAPGIPVDPGTSALAGIKSEDNWTMAEMQAFGQGASVKSTTIPIASAGMHRFTGSNPSFDINARPDTNCPDANAVRELEFAFHTGNDDLRGGDDNVGITIHFADGTIQAAGNVNQGQRWADGSAHSVKVLLNRPVPPDQIRSITLETTFKGSTNGDNWNMDSVEILADTRPLANYGFHRFSADWTGPKAKQLTIPIK